MGNNVIFTHRTVISLLDIEKAAFCRNSVRVVCLFGKRTQTLAKLEYLGCYRSTMLCKRFMIRTTIVCKVQPVPKQIRAKLTTAK